MTGRNRKERVNIFRVETLAAEDAFGKKKRAFRMVVVNFESHG